MLRGEISCRVLERCHVLRYNGSAFVLELICFCCDGVDSKHRVCCDTHHLHNEAKPACKSHCRSGNLSPLCQTHIFCRGYLLGITELHKIPTRPHSFQLTTYPFRSTISQTALDTNPTAAKASPFATGLMPVIMSLADPL